MREVEKPVPTAVEQIATQVVDAAYRVHVNLGLGLLEKVYETCLARELTQKGLRVQRQVMVPVLYDGVKLDADLHIDLWVNECLVVEVKTVEALHTAQLMTYLRLTGNRLDFLLNFNLPTLKGNIKRVIL